MPLSKDKATAATAVLMEKMLDEGSGLMSHAQALADYVAEEEAAAEWARAAKCEEDVSCLLEADGQELEAAIHRVSAASCFGKLGQFTRAVTQLRAALSSPLDDELRIRVSTQLKVCLSSAHKELRRLATLRPRKRLSAVN